MNTFSKITLALAAVGLSGVAQAGFLAEIEANNTLATAQNVMGSVTSGGAPSDVGGNPWVSISGTGDGTYDYYSFTVAAGANVTMDIDNNQDLGFDLEMFLYDSAGLLLANNDDTFGPDPDGSTGTVGFDPYINHTFASAGTYIVAVCAFNCFDNGGGAGVGGSAPSAGETYDLNISGGLAAVAAPEPTTLALFGLGLAGIGFIGRRRRS